MKQLIGSQTRKSMLDTTVLRTCVIQFSQLEHLDFSISCFILTELHTAGKVECELDYCGLTLFF
jgi:hypothetical protein